MAKIKKAKPKTCPKPKKKKGTKKAKKIMYA